MAHVTSARENTNGLPRVPSIPLADETNSAGDQSIGNLVKDATTHLSTLVRAEVELAKSEVVGEIRKGLTGSVYFIVALVLLLLLLPFLLTTAALGINKGLWDWAQPWGGFFVIVLLMAALAGFFAWRGTKKVKAIRAPQKTIATMKDTAAVLRSRGESDHDHAPVPTSGDAVRRD